MIKAAVIGTGHIARQHISCLKTLAAVDLCAVCDLSPATVEAMSERFGIARYFVDYRRMLEEMRPDVVHITTPASTHFRLACDSLDCGAHVIVEKPITTTMEQWRELRLRAKGVGRVIIEDHNYLFNRSVQTILGLIRSGEFGEVTHVEAMICLDIQGPGSRFTDPNIPHPALREPGGAISDFLTHLSYLGWAFVGPHRSVRVSWTKRRSDSPLPADEMRALVAAERGTALLAFSSHSQPDAFWLRVYGTRMRAAANLFEPRLTMERLHGGPRPLIPLRNGLREGWDVAFSAVAGLWRKLGGGPGAYEGLWELLRRTYGALETGGVPPVSLEQIDDVNRLVADLTKEESRL